VAALVGHFIFDRWYVYNCPGQQQSNPRVSQSGSVYAGLDISLANKTFQRTDSWKRDNILEAKSDDSILFGVVASWIASPASFTARENVLAFLMNDRYTLESHSTNKITIYTPYLVIVWIRPVFDHQTPGLTSLMLRSSTTTISSVPGQQLFRALRIYPSASQVDNPCSPTFHSFLATVQDNAPSVSEASPLVDRTNDFLPLKSFELHVRFDQPCFHRQNQPDKPPRTAPTQKEYNWAAVEIFSEVGSFYRNLLRPWLHRNHRANWHDLSSWPSEMPSPYLSSASSSWIGVIVVWWQHFSVFLPLGWEHCLRYPFLMIWECFIVSAKCGSCWIPFFCCYWFEVGCVKSKRNSSRSTFWWIYVFFTNLMLQGVVMLRTPPEILNRGSGKSTPVLLRRKSVTDQVVIMIFVRFM